MFSVQIFLSNYLHISTLHFSNTIPKYRNTMKLIEGIHVVSLATEYSCYFLDKNLVYKKLALNT